MQTTLKHAVTSCALALAAVATPQESSAMMPGVAMAYGPAIFTYCALATGPMVFACTTGGLMGVVTGSSVGAAVTAPAASSMGVNPFLVALDAEKPEAGFALDALQHLRTQVELGALSRSEADAIALELTEKFNEKAPRSLDGRTLADFTSDRSSALEGFCQANGLSRLTGAYLANAIFGINL